jgi:hypothetical protein
LEEALLTEKRSPHSGRINGGANDRRDLCERVKLGALR